MSSNRRQRKEDQTSIQGHALGGDDDLMIHSLLTPNFHSHTHYCILFPGSGHFCTFVAQSSNECSRGVQMREPLPSPGRKHTQQLSRLPLSASAFSNVQKLFDQRAQPEEARVRAILQRKDSRRTSAGTLRTPHFRREKNRLNRLRLELVTIRQQSDKVWLVRGPSQRIMPRP